MSLQMRLILFLFILFLSLPISVFAELEKESVIIEVEGDPEEHKEYIEKNYPLVEVVAVYQTLFNGLALQAKPKNLEKMDSLEFVKVIHSVQKYEALPSKATSEVFQSPLKLENKNRNLVFPSELNTTDYTGKGVKVGVIDTGIDYEHPDLTANYKAGYDLVDLDDDPMETLKEEGLPTLHGSHVSGIIAANGDLQGVAPDADIYAYRALGPGGAGTSVQVIAAMEQAVEDGVDVMNLSLGNTVNGPDYPTSVAVNRAVELGIPVVIANGNSGPDEWTVGAPATASKALSVGASQNPLEVPYLSERLKKIAIPLQLMLGSVPWEIEKSLPVEKIEEPSLQGKIALVPRGDVPFYELAKKAEKKGAEAVLIYNNEDKPAQGSIQSGEDPVKIPVAMITKEEGELLLRHIKRETLYLDTKMANTDVTIASFSSRGPVTVNWDIKPDIVAPGTNIVSTVPDGYQALQGTSMATPHVAGVIALIKEARPNWTVEQIYGALETTATPLVNKEDAFLKPIEQGTGMVQPEKAIDTDVIIHNPKLVFGDIQAAYKETKTIHLTVENVSDKDQTFSFDIPNKEKWLHWNVPKTFTIEANQTKEIPVELSVTSSLLEEGLHQGWLTIYQEDEPIYLPYLFVNQKAENPKAMGFEFSLKPFSNDAYSYGLYVTDPTERIEVNLYHPQTLMYNRRLLELEEIDIGMNEGEIEKKEVGEPGQYLAVITIYLEDGRKENYETMVYIEGEK